MPMLDCVGPYDSLYGGYRDSRMAKPIDFVPSDDEHGEDEATIHDNTCPECGEDSIVSYLDRYVSYEYCTSCEWSDEDEDTVTREIIGRPGRHTEEA